MRIALVVNPDSGRRLDAREIADGLRAHGADVAVCERGWDGDAVEASRPERVVAAGGDGIIGPCADLAGRLGVPLAVVPAGTANDFARAAGLPNDLAEACELAARGQQTRRLELARIEGRPFVNAASAGLAPVAARRAVPLKKLLGPAAYFAGAAAAGLTSDPFECVASVDGEQVFEGPAWQVTVAATGAFGAGSGLAEADPGDGRLDLVVIPGGPRLALPRRAIGMRRQTLASQDGVTHARGTSVELALEAGTAFNVDGELVEIDGELVRLGVEAAAYALVVPAG